MANAQKIGLKFYLIVNPASLYPALESLFKFSVLSEKHEAFFNILQPLLSIFVFIFVKIRSKHWKCFVSRKTTLN